MAPWQFVDVECFRMILADFVASWTIDGLWVTCETPDVKWDVR